MASLYAATVLAAALVAGVAIVLLRPLLVRYALARPNARSSHVAPTPQGGGIAVVGATLAVAAAAIAVSGVAVDASGLAMAAAAALGLAVIGALDDIRPVGVLPRLVLQAIAVGVAVAATGSDLRLLPGTVPHVVEQVLVVVAGIWFVNLVNFMDGLDWMTVAETVPISGAMALFALAGNVSLPAGLVAAALFGAMLGFAPFNRPVARLFLGDVGSLPIGLILAWLLYGLAGAGPLAAAVLLPLYYCVDATLTLLRRLVRGEPVWQAHRTHFYQRATDNGLPVKAVVAHVFVLNLGLAVLAASSFLWRTAEAQVALVAIGLAAVGLVLARFARPQSKLARP